MKRILACDTLLAYPDFNEELKFYTDDSKFQLWDVIIRNGKPIIFYGRKITDAQRRYTVTEKELLSIFETLKEFRNILFGQIFRIHTDTKNLTCKSVILIECKYG